MLDYGPFTIQSNLYRNGTLSISDIGTINPLIFLCLHRRISFKGAVSEAEVRDSSVEMLQSYLTSIIESIVGSVDQCPPVMRVAFKQLHKRVEEQFAEPENEVSLEQNTLRIKAGTTFLSLSMYFLFILHSLYMFYIPLPLCTLHSYAEWQSSDL